VTGGEETGLQGTVSTWRLYYKSSKVVLTSPLLQTGFTDTWSWKPTAPAFEDSPETEPASCTVPSSHPP
jgi:hypothetical protein